MAMSDGVPIPEDPSQDVLTGTPLPLQCPAASVVAEEMDEADGPAVQAFIETLARIAHAVAARRARREPEDT